MRKPKLYRRVTGEHQFGIARGGWVSLHLAADHLLLRNTVTLTETYRRFYFTDVEAITIRKTLRWHIWTAVWSVAVALCLLPLLGAQRLHPGLLTWAAIFIVCALINITRGASCVTHLQTKVQTRPLPLRRVRKALRVLKHLVPPIAAAQADIATASADPTAAETPVVRQPDPAKAEGPPPLAGEQLPMASSPVHLALFGLLIATGMAAAVEAFRHHSWLMYLVYALLLLNICAAVGVLVLQRRRRFSHRFTAIAWISTIGHGVAMPAAYTVYSWVYAFHRVSTSRGAAADNVQGFQLKLSALRDMPGFDYVLMAYAALAMLLGFVGCVLMVTQPKRAAVAVES